MTSGIPGVAQGVDPGADGEFGDAVERRQSIFGETEIADEIEFLRTRRKLDHIGRASSMDSNFASPPSVFTRRVMFFSTHLLAQVHGNRLDEYVAAQYAVPVHV